MANKITITIDLTKIDKNRIVNRTYQNKEGQTVTVKEYSMDCVELITPKLIKEADTWMLKETHFVTDAPTKEERQTKTKMKGLGKAIGIFNKANTTAEETRAKITAQVNNDYNEVENAPTSTGYNGEEIDPSSIPF